MLIMMIFIFILQSWFVFLGFYYSFNETITFPTSNKHATTITSAERYNVSLAMLYCNLTQTEAALQRCS